MWYLRKNVKFTSRSSRASPTPLLDSTYCFQLVGTRGRSGKCWSIYLTEEWATTTSTFPWRTVQWSHLSTQTSSTRHWGTSWFKRATKWIDWKWSLSGFSLPEEKANTGICVLIMTLWSIRVFHSLFSNQSREIIISSELIDPSSCLTYPYSWPI